MKINYDKVADAIYFTVKNAKVAKSVKVDDHLVVDMSSDGEIVGMELLDASSEQGAELEKNLRDGVPVNIVTSTPATV
ncbi:MAG: DUF2283 domain-containing protein [Candidatus Pacebacteria bacterium]|nr:DUF2283 domain-containing protein [Candidatus Paceibacterota bacterium]